MIRVEVNDEKTTCNFKDTNTNEAIVAIARLVSIIHYHQLDLKNKVLFNEIKRCTRIMEEEDKKKLKYLEKQEKKVTRKEKNRK
jgi:hypothetical protein